MAIAFDTSGSGNAGGGSASFSLAAGAADNVAIILLSYDTGSGATDCSVTVDGNATTEIGSEFSGTGALANKRIMMFYYVDPPTTSVTYQATTTGTGNGIQFTAHIYSGVDTTDPVDSTGTGSGTSTTSATFSTTVVAENCWLASFIQTSAGGFAASTGTTLRENIAGAGAEGSGDSNGTVGTGSQSMAWTFNSGDYVGRILSIQPESATFTPKAIFF